MLDDSLIRGQLGAEPEDTNETVSIRMWHCFAIVCEYRNGEKGDKLELDKMKA